jgi:TPR repeat
VAEAIFISDPRVDPGQRFFGALHLGFHPCGGADRDGLRQTRRQQFASIRLWLHRPFVPGSAALVSAERVFEDGAFATRTPRSAILLIAPHWRRFMRANRRRAVANVVMFPVTMFALSAMTVLTTAQSLKDFKCTGNADVAWDEQLVGCTEAIRSGKFPEMSVAAAFRNRGNAYATKGDLERAIADYDQATRLNPDDAPAYNNRGFAHAIKKNYDHAIADYDQAIHLNPHYARAFINRGNIYFLSITVVIFV